MSSDAPPSSDGAPYHVDQIVGPDGDPRWRLAGPGLGPTKAYPWAEVRDKLDELAALMNFAWGQARVTVSGDGDPGEQAGAAPPSPPGRGRG